MATPTISSFLEEHPSIKYYLPTSPEFDTIKTTFLATPNHPSVIARPQSADDVAALVSHCVATDTPFVVRTGGHDIDGRSLLPDILQIDMRDIAYVEVAPDKKTARIGGGILHGGLLEKLDKHGLMATTGTVGTVGFCGWATLGGYGPFAPTFGFGFDQIVGARLVNAEGKPIEACEDLLEGLRGGGGTFGVVTEFTIKVYPVQEIQAGLLIHAAPDNDMPATIMGYFAKLNALLESAGGLPSNLALQPNVLPIPNMGPTFATSFVWLGPLDDEAKKWQENIVSLAPVAMNTISTTTPLAYITALTVMISPVVHAGRCLAVTTRGLQLSPSAAKAVAKHGAAMPARSTVTSLLFHHGFSARNAETPSVFGLREEHVTIEIVGHSAVPEGGPEGKTWAEGFQGELGAAEGALDWTYLPLTPAGSDLRKVFGDKYERLVELKRRFDPNNVFKNSIPRLEV